MKQTTELIRKDLTPEEIAGRKDELSTNLLMMNEHDERLKKAKEEHKTSVDPIKARNKELLTDIKLGFVDERMLVHNVPDDEKGIIEFYTEDGELVGSRKMTREEKPTIKFPVEH